MLRGLTVRALMCGCLGMLCLASRVQSEDRTLMKIDPSLLKPKPEKEKENEKEKEKEEEEDE